MRTQPTTLTAFGQHKARQLSGAAEENLFNFAPEVQQILARIVRRQGSAGERRRNCIRIAAEPGNDIPRTSVRLFIVVAVPIVLQYPVEGAAEATSLMKPSRSI